MDREIPDLFILAAEPSADLHGANLIRDLLALRPQLKIIAVAGPKMRALPIQTLFPMESLQVMGFIDVLFALPKIIRQFFAIRNAILALNPKAVVCIDYPGFNLRLERSLRKKGYTGKLIHYICPTVWAWGRKRIPKMAQTLDLLLTLFPFEKQCFSHTALPTHYVGHPLPSKIPAATPPPSTLLALFPGSRETEIRRNFPFQLQAARSLLAQYPSLRIAVSIAHAAHEPLLRSLSDFPVTFYPPERNYELMRSSHLAIATSGTVTLELALHSVPTIVTFMIRPLDLFIAQKIFRINLPFYCIVNIILNTLVFPELFGPNLTLPNLTTHLFRLWTDAALRAQIQQQCTQVREALGEHDASHNAAQAILSCTNC